MNSQNNEIEIARNDDFYNLIDFCIVMFVLGMLLATPFLISNSIATKWVVIFSIFAFVISFFFSSFFYLNKTKFYGNRIEVKYFIKHNSIKTKTIQLKDVIALTFSYTGARGSGGCGRAKVYYNDNGNKRKIMCSMGLSSAKKVCYLMKVNSITTTIKPSGLFQN